MPGKYSLILIPETLVGMEANSPRTSEGASSFRSKVSIWEGPPARKTMITAFCEEPVPNTFSACNNPGRLMPPIPKAPTFKKSLRETPSQKLDLFPSVNVIMILVFL
jgi:hypothetical protein